ncbi:MAG: hypothetical protein U7126_23030 [Microcoleus sp.]
MLTVGSWQLAVGSWQLAVNSWQLTVDSWQLTVNHQDTPKAHWCQLNVKRSTCLLFEH